MFVSRQPHYLFPSDRLLHRITIATNCLLTVKDYHQSINRALNALGLATDVDRIYIFENHPHPETEQPSISQRWEWVAENVKPEFELAQDGLLIKLAKTAEKIGDLSTLYS